jgi:DNA gyrase subunit B
MTQDMLILTWREAVRKRPVMYTGSTGIWGFINLLKDFFASHYKYTDITKWGSNMSVINLEAGKSAFEITGKQSGIFRYIGLKNPISGNICENLIQTNFDFAVLNGLSQTYEFSLFDKDKKEILKQVYQQGILQSGKVDEKEHFADTLEIKFELDSSIWDEFEINPHFVAEVIEELAFLNEHKIFELKYSVNDEPCQIIYQFENGLRDLIKIKGFKGIGLTVFATELEYKSEEYSADICLSFWDYSINEPFFKSFVNNHYTHEGGTHKKALLSGIGRALRKYVKEHKPNEFFVITDRTILSCLIGGIHLKMKQPRFEGSTKNKLANKEIIKPISDFVFEKVYEKLKSDKETAKKVIRHFYEIHWNKKWLERL